MTQYELDNLVKPSKRSAPTGDPENELQCKRPKKAKKTKTAKERKGGRSAGKKIRRERRQGKGYFEPWTERPNTTTRPIATQAATTTTLDTDA